METNEIFENYIKIEPKVVSIETLFNNQETLKNTKYDPDYQRNYVWDDDKATYFIESILLGTEIPPIIYFRNEDRIEVIDGRQRYQTILRFIKNEFKLKNSGLHKLNNIGIASKSFKDIGERRDDFWDTKLRIIEFSFHTTKLDSIDILEDIVKKEIFKRYNSGITPLKPTEIDKAYYFEDDLNSFLQEKLKSDQVIMGDIQDIFYLEKSNMERILKKIRQLLVQHKIPIKYYAVKKDVIINKYYELLSSQINEENISLIFPNFIEKINIIKSLKKISCNNGYFYNRLVSECVFWSLSIIEENDFIISKIDEIFIKNLSNYIEEHKDAFEMDRSSFSKELQTRYKVTSDFFSNQCKVDFKDYLITTNSFKQENKYLGKNIEAANDSEETSFDDLRINKPEPSSITIVDICRQMERQRFLIRPPYQRSEVKNRNKSSAIIESILLGIKLPPIFVYKREDGISEVLDGQQRLLSILGFLEKEYLDENNEKQKSNKHGYSLNLKNGILKDLHGENSRTLEEGYIKKINNFDLWIIEINHRYNKDFEPIDLFLRLNSKPYPIKENTFEMWNSYISKEIIEKIKKIYSDNKEWFYLRKNNKRMENETIYASLTYLIYSLRLHNDYNQTLEYYKVGERINFRIKAKSELTKVLEDPNTMKGFLEACDDLKFVFIEKVKNIVSIDGITSSNEQLNNNLDILFNVSSSGRRTQQSFYALWFFLKDIPLKLTAKNKIEMNSNIKDLYLLMNNVSSKEKFDNKLESFLNRYKG